MPAPTLPEALRILKRNEDELRRMGVAHAAVFGSVARSEEREGSDVDILVDLDVNHPIGIFEYARLKWFVGELFGGAGDVVNRKTLKPLLKENILRDAVNAF